MDLSQNNLEDIHRQVLKVRNQTTTDSPYCCHGDCCR